MQHLLVERPRVYRGHRSRKSPGYPGGTRKNERGTRDLEGLPSCESLGKGYTEKHFNENLRPLFRFLLKGVGRTWNAVYSELCEHVQATSTVQRHILQHVHQYVRLDVVRDANGWLRAVGALRPLTFHQGYPILYVCPRTGILRQIEQKDVPHLTARRIDVDTYLVKLHGAWNWVSLAPIPAVGTAGAVLVDAISKQSVQAHQFRQSLYDYPRPWDTGRYVEKVRPLTKRERVEYLSNSPATPKVVTRKKAGPK